MLPAPPRPARGAAPRRAAALGASMVALLALSGCGGDDEKFAPPCPQPSIPRDFNDLHRYRGAGRDLVDSVLEGRITGVSGSCTRDGPGTTVVTVAVNMELIRGPAANSRNAEVAYFVAVSQGENILDKRVFRLRAEFPANTDRVRLSGDEVELRLPVTATRTAASYRVTVGFEITPLELEANRRAQALRGRPAAR